MDGFEILSKLGDGSYSVVYKVRRKADGNIYALKKVKLQNLSEKEKENSLNEVRILASVKSAFVISYKEAFIEEEDKSLCLVMEYADKGDLYQKIVQFKKMRCLVDEVDVWRIFIQMTKGLKALHDLNILHRDLKSANIFLFSDGSAKIGDLNVSKVAKKGLGYTQTGTPYYASPEVWEDKPYNSKSDIWSLACVTYEMLALHPPFRAEDMEGLYHQVIKGKYKNICSKYSPDISEMLKVLFKVKPEERPSCQEILNHPLVKKRLEFFKAEAGFDDDDFNNDAVLLRTIRIPNNILNLSDKLPEANYDSPMKFNKKISGSSKNNTANNLLPDIKNKTGKESNNTDNEENKTKMNKKNYSQKNNKINLTCESKEKEINLNNNNIQLNNQNGSNNDINLPEHRKYKQKKNINNIKSVQMKQYISGIGINDCYKIYSPKMDGNGNIYNNGNRNIIDYNSEYQNIIQNNRNNSHNVVHNMTIISIIVIMWFIIFIQGNLN